MQTAAKDSVLSMLPGLTRPQVCLANRKHFNIIGLRVSYICVPVRIGVDQAHNQVECSNMGVCDRSTGLCTCREGFEGIACERQSCPSKCNGVGKMILYTTYIFCTYIINTLNI